MSNIIVAGKNQVFEKDAPKEVAVDPLGLQKEYRAKYKIEVTFDQNRTINGPNVLGIQIWESGKHFNGDGDDLVFWCGDNQGKERGCGAPILAEQIRGGIALCTHCKRTINAERLSNIEIGRVTSKTLSERLVKIFHELNRNADIYLKYHRTDARYIAMERAKGPDVAARLKGMHIYPLKNILRDTAAGADLTKRFLAFVTS